MKPFRFNLQRILEYRATRAEEEERKLTALQVELAGLEQAIQQVKQSRDGAARSLATAEQARGEELWALTDFCARLDEEHRALEQKKSGCAQRLARQQESYMAARRDLRLLEKLRDKRLAEWTIEAGREMDKVAGELYLARWKGDNQ
jgi:flagellar protein FliJ